jgi:Ribosomal protein L14E/L6E/L27E
MNKIPIEPGRVVLSKAGRDAGRRFMVLQVDETFAIVADGDLRKVENPKKKKRMHLRAVPEFFSSIVGILEDGKLPSNAEIRRCLTERPPREE